MPTPDASQFTRMKRLETVQTPLRDTSVKNVPRLFHYNPRVSNLKGTFLPLLTGKPPDRS